MPIDAAARKLTDTVEGASVLDKPAKFVVGKLGRLTKAGKFKDLISGSPMGHPVHPPLTELVIGSFMSTTALDVLAPNVGAKAANRLTAVGMAAFLPAALSGASDWVDTEYGDEKSRRIGLVHATVNVVALALYGAALRARRRGNRAQATLLSLSGAGVLSSAGYLGGHMTFVRGVGVNQTAFESGGPTDWTPVLPAADLAEGKVHGGDAGGTPVLLGRVGGQVYAIHDTCTHRGCPISAGSDPLDGHTVTCFCHGSKFDIRDGGLLQGPAIIGQPTFQCREADGQIEVRKPG
ncbi:Rieske 2Fe-2S domain-containing protein [Mycobacterium sp. M1]|uniref:Rieske 2Fe-2S domain-containing protein n=1 Tax=Mycolicibacter acidiphilus TaxID=2835306 RepID=A0ABS5REL8_9MYCO|nr:Rieske 2Fe-2S domain-containing protein [Mycolicibacter acidiphilus]MBS9532713.1 Rieske 2Fe-2S domain-containing protein [Mycolicibacter acidiphilus]